MTALSHALIGAAIAAKIPHPELAAGVAVATHLICDAVPHWDLGTNWRLRPKAITGILAICETLLAILVSYWLFSRFVPSQMVLGVAIVFSLIPDWLEAPYFILQPHPPKIFYYIYKGQSLMHERLQAPLGVITQIVVVAAFLIVGFMV